MSPLHEFVAIRAFRLYSLLVPLSRIFQGSQFVRDNFSLVLMFSCTFDRVLSS